MKVAQFSAFGNPEEMIECVDVDDVGEPAAGEVVLDVLAFPINPADLLLIEGRYATRPQLPARLGAECLGRIAAVGNGVDNVGVGDLVVPLMRENWVQRRRLKATNVVQVPQEVPVAQLAMLRVNPPTAWLIQDAANSGVGRCLIKLAKAEGIHTVNVVRRSGLETELAALGADVIAVDGPDLAQEVKAVTHGAEIRLAIDAIGGEQVTRLGDCLVDEGIILNYGLLSGKAPRLRADQTVFRRLWLTGFWLAPWLENMTMDEVKELYGMLAARIADGTLEVPVEATYPMEQLKEAVAHAAGYRRAGKILVTPNGPID